MKRFVILLVCAVVLTACGDDKDTAGDDDKNNTTQSEEAEDSSASVEFRKIDVNVKEDNVLAVGEAKPKDETFYFTFEQGENVLVKETPVKLEKNAQGWGSFEIELELSQKLKETKEVPVITLYDKTESGKKVNVNYLPVDLSVKSQ